MSDKMFEFAYRCNQCNAGMYDRGTRLADNGREW